MTRDRGTITEQERDDLCDALMGYQGNRAASAPARFDKHIVPTVERTIAAHVTQALEQAAAKLEQAAETMCAGCDSCDGGSRTAMECAVGFLRGDA